MKFEPEDAPMVLVIVIAMLIGALEYALLHKMAGGSFAFGLIFMIFNSGLAILLVELNKTER